ncbi:hypothetical protein DFAR_680001 [Desulfarculales bacterium]
MLVLELIVEGSRQKEERQSRFASYKALDDFCQRVRDVHGSIICRNLLGVDLGMPQGQKEIQERGLFMNQCP